MVLMTGLAASADKEESSTAPVKPPIAPGAASSPTVRQSMLRKRQCAVPDASVVPSSAR
jgi:hypothetical protein